MENISQMNRNRKNFDESINFKVDELSLSLIQTQKSVSIQRIQNWIKMKKQLTVHSLIDDQQNVNRRIIDVINADMKEYERNLSKMPPLENLVKRVIDSIDEEMQSLKKLRNQVVDEFSPMKIFLAEKIGSIEDLKLCSGLRRSSSKLAEQNLNKINEEIDIVARKCAEVESKISVANEIRIEFGAKLPQMRKLTDEENTKIYEQKLLTKVKEEELRNLEMDAKQLKERRSKCGGQVEVAEMEIIPLETRKKDLPTKHEEISTKNRMQSNEMNKQKSRMAQSQETEGKATQKESELLNALAERRRLYLHLKRIREAISNKQQYRNELQSHINALQTQMFGHEVLQGIQKRIIAKKCRFVENNSKLDQGLEMSKPSKIAKLEDHHDHNDVVTSTSSKVPMVPEGLFQAVNQVLESTAVSSTNVAIIEEIMVSMMGIDHSFTSLS